MNRMKHPKPAIRDPAPSGWGLGFPLAPMLKAEFGEACAIEEYAFLFGLAALLRPGRVLEIGTSCGLGAISIALGVQLSGASCEVVTIDRKQASIAENLKLFPGISASIHPLVGDSHSVLKELQSRNEKFDFCFIDGGHDFDTVAKDWQFAEMLADRWLLHDSASQPGVGKLLQQIRTAGKYQVFAMNYPPGHQLDEPTGEWYRTLTAPGFCLIQANP